MHSAAGATTAGGKIKRKHIFILVLVWAKIELKKWNILTGLMKSLFFKIYFVRRLLALQVSLAQGVT